MTEYRSNTSLAVFGPQFFICVVVRLGGPGLLPAVRCRRQCSNSWKEKGLFIAATSSALTFTVIDFNWAAWTVACWTSIGIGFGAGANVPSKRVCQASGLSSIARGMILRVTGIIVKSFIVLEAAQSAVAKLLSAFVREVVVVRRFRVVREEFLDELP